MPEWWSYSLSDFLLFSPRTYYRLIERYNLAVWPGQIGTLAAGLGILALLRRRPAGYERFVWGIVAVLWGWVAVAFLWKRYGTINWAVIYLVPLFLLELLLLLWKGVARNALSLQADRGSASVVGWGLFAFSVLAYPAVASAFGRSWRQAEVFGLAPDPTAIGTAGLVLLTRHRWQLGAVPLVWCIFSALTLWAMQSPEALLPGLTAIAFVTFAVRSRWPRNS